MEAKDFVGRYFKYEGIKNSEYRKIIEVDEDGDYLEMCVCIRRKRSACIDTRVFTSEEWLRLNTEITREEFLEAYDKALKILNEERSKL